MSGLVSTLFISAFVSATLLPGSSEIVLVGVLSSNEVAVGLAVLVATIGNTLGSCVNWGIGRFFSHHRSHKWFPVPHEKYDRFTTWYQRWGIWSLLLSWLPVIGDPLTVIAGISRTPILVFTTFVFVAKAVRYLVVAGIFLTIW